MSSLLGVCDGIGALVLSWLGHSLFLTGVVACSDEWGLLGRPPVGNWNVNQEFLGVP